MVLVIANEWHVVSFLVEPIIVEESLNESVIWVEFWPVRRRSIDVKAELIAFTHAVNELLADVFANVLSTLRTECFFDDLWSERCKVSFVLHESSDWSLLIPDEQVFLIISCGLAQWNELAKRVARPWSVWYVSFNHGVLQVFVSWNLFFYKIWSKDHF